MIDDIDMILAGSNDTVAITSKSCFLLSDMERLQTLKGDIIHRAIITSSKMRDNLTMIMKTAQNFHSRIGTRNQHRNGTS